MFKTLARLSAGFFVALAIGGCTQLPGINKQGYAGINEARVELEDGVPVSVHVIGGKEQQDIAMTFELPNGLKATYSATDVRAFDGQAVRGEVERVLAEAQKDGVIQVTPAIVDGIVKAITGL